MGNIQILQATVACHIAAGEVVKRPASVVKELMENSLDAKANRIEVEIVRSGTILIRVSDNGVGMDREDALLCLQRHATSKLRTEKDLRKILTFGFRGEAIASIASISKLRITTRQLKATVGTEVLAQGGGIESVRESGGAYGTQVEVRSLFFNVPARKQSLRGLPTEAGHVINQVRRIALAHPQVAFTEIHDSRKVLQLSATGELGVRIRDLFGQDWTRSLVPGKSVKVPGIQVDGFLSYPNKGRMNQSGQFIYVNGRPVISSTISLSLREAYSHFLPKGYHPGAIVFLKVDPNLIDCNVHPTKQEIRFISTSTVGEAIRRFSKSVLEQTCIRLTPPTREFRHSTAEASQKSTVESKKILKEFGVSFDQTVDCTLKRNLLRQLSCQLEHLRNGVHVPPEQVEIQNLLEWKNVTVVGRIAARFAILESIDGMVVMDMRAAKERILFESILNRMKNGCVASQHLLLPIVLDLPMREVAWISTNVTLLRRIGVKIEPFGGNSVKIEAIPPFLEKVDTKQFLLKLRDDLVCEGMRTAYRMKEDTLARSVSRLAADAALPRESRHIEILLRELLRCDFPYSCPGGRATMVPITISELRRRFGYRG